MDSCTHVRKTFYNLSTMAFSHKRVIIQVLKMTQKTMEKAYRCVLKMWQNQPQQWRRKPVVNVADTKRIFQDLHCRGQGIP